MIRSSTAYCTASGCSCFPPQECIRSLVDAFAADVNAKDSAGRTPMASLIARHKAQRPGVGAHAASKLHIIDALRARHADDDDDDSSVWTIEDDASPMRLKGMMSPVKGLSSPAATATSGLLGVCLHAQWLMEIAPTRSSHTTGSNGVVHVDVCCTTSVCFLCDHVHTEHGWFVAGGASQSPERGSGWQHRRGDATAASGRSAVR